MMDTKVQADASLRDKWTLERVISVRWWTPNLLSFRTTRPAAFRFTPGHYTRLGLGAADSIAWRPFSMASAAHEDFLDFIAVLVPGGEFSQKLKFLGVGDRLRIDAASYGFLTVSQLAPGQDLWLLASGTGLGPFVSILRDPTVWRNFERLILVHSVRQQAELAWREEIVALPDAFPEARARFHYIPVVTREPGASKLAQRIPLLLADGSLEREAGTPISLADSRLMVCGNPELARELRESLGARGFATNRRNVPGQMAFEKYW